MRRALPLVLLSAPAVVLGVVGVVVVSSATARHAAMSFGDPRHFAIRQLIALGLGLGAAVVVVRAGSARAMRSAPVVFAVTLVAALAVFLPGLGVRAAGARRWLHLGPMSFAPAPLLTLGVAMLVAAWGRRARHADGAEAPPLRDARQRRALAVALGACAVLTLVAEPDFSAAAIAGLVGITALAGIGIGGRRLVPAAIVFALVLLVFASRFGYVGGRLYGFFAPERDRRGAGFEVLALERAVASPSLRGVGLGHGEARRHLSSPGSDYVYAVIVEELGELGGGAVLLAWVAIGGAALLAARRAEDRRLRALALASGAALLAPAALHVAVCTGLVPIIGVTMPLVSYDPGATLAAGAELGLVAAVITSEVA